MTVLVALTGLFFTVGKPIINLNNNIVRLNMHFESLRERTDRQEQALETQRERAHASHQRLWEHNEKQDQRLDVQEKRLHALERQ